ncbi:lipopolysaccharide biosynthesis protein [Thalassotalea maritima]|uniref:lipopolysaccharide biosynthesis protein n=1 Tax=Thalassotalea maritima TaxID=3242416 RepID=UPI0035299CAF
MNIVNGSLLMIITRLIIKSLGLISSICLARLLQPEDFGIVAIAMAIYAFICLFGSFGLESIIIQRQTKHHDDYNTVWTINVLFSCIAAISLILCAPYIAIFYDDSRIVDVIYAISSMFIISGLRNIGVIEFQQDLNFQKELRFQVTPKLISFIFTLTAAYLLNNYWALVYGMIFNSVLQVIISYWMHPYRPKLGLKKAGSMLSFSKWLLANNILFYINTRAIDLIIGKVISARATGVFSIANEFGSLPTTEMAAPINKATFPVYSKLANSPVELRHSYANTISLIGLLALPSAFGIAITCEIFIPVALGEKWLAAIPIMQTISLTSIITCLTSNAGYLFIALGLPKVTFAANLFRALILTISMILLIPEYGLMGACYSIILSAIASFINYSILVKNQLSFSILNLLNTVYRPALSCILMVYAVYQYQLIDHSMTLYNLFLQILIGFITYTSSIVLIWHLTGKQAGIEKDIATKFNLLVHRLNQKENFNDFN